MRNNKTVIYGSSYDRGLEHLLKMWPEIKRAVPEAELRIFYGWDMFDRVYHDNPERQMWKEKINQMMEEDGIVHLGRISHDACVKEHENAGIWAYPTHFGEISCITAMRAQVYGSIPVVVDYAALQETVKWGVKVEGDIYDKETSDRFKEELINLLKSDEAQEIIRVPMMEWAKKEYSWSKVAKQWTDEFRGPVSLEKQIDELMDDNQPLKAWELIKDTDHPLKDKVYAKVKHAFDPKEYKKFYSEDLEEVPTPQGTILPDRFVWVLDKLEKQKPKTMIDLGCADGILPLICAKRGILSTGINLYKPSVDYANAQSKKYGLYDNLMARFLCMDIFDKKGEYDAVVLMEVLEHLPDPQKGIDHAMSLVKKGGSLYISTPRTDHLGVELHKQEVGRKKWDEDGTPSGHLQLFTEEEVKKMLSKYKIEEMKIDNERCMLLEVKHNV